LQVAIGKNGRPVAVQIETRSGSIHAKVWRVKVGRCDLFLLDSDVEDNAPDDRGLTSRLYGGDARTRIRQELLLGVGGFRALKAMGITPGVLHLNEGHSGLPCWKRFAAAWRKKALASRSPCPVSPAKSSSPPTLPSPPVMIASMPISSKSILDLCVTASAFPRKPDGPRTREARRLPGNFLHDRARPQTLAPRQRRLRPPRRSLPRHVDWPLPGKPEDEVPIGHITNGVHVPSWLAPQMFRLYDRHLGTNWHQHSSEAKIWEGIENVDDGELWETHLSLKSQLLEFVRRRAVEQARRRSESRESLQRLGSVLSPDALTIGFARRFATYKRANLILSDIESLASMVNDPKRPVQFVFAGKAHPHDEPGKKVCSRLPN